MHVNYKFSLIDVVVIFCIKKNVIRGREFFYVRIQSYERCYYTRNLTSNFALKNRDQATILSISRLIQGNKTFT